MIAKRLSIYLLLLMLFIPTFSVAYASKVENDSSFDYMLQGYDSKKYFRQNEGPGAKRRSGNVNHTPDRYIYETPTVKALSHLVWALNLYKVEDDFAVDEFMRINECDMYRSFNSDEVEWEKIRDATRDFLIENKSDFPTRFEFMLPIKLGDYIESKGVIEVQDDFKIKNLRRFELVASDYREASDPCVRGHIVAKGYPRAMVLEFSRPFNLTHVPVAKEQAMRYIKEKLNIMKKKYDRVAQSKKLALSLRTAYLLIKVKIFTYGKFLGLNYQELLTVQMMGVLEGYEIYEDYGRERLMYSQNYVTARKKGKLNTRLKPQYEILRKRAAGEGMLH